MDHNETDRKIAALTAIVQTMLPELYCDAPHNTQQPFDNAVSDDDPLALAISETLTPDEIAHAFAWAKAPLRSPDEELAAIPVVPCLGAQHQGVIGRFVPRITVRCYRRREIVGIRLVWKGRPRRVFRGLHRAVT